MKKILTLLFLVCLLVPLAGCGGQKADSAAARVPASSAAPAATTTPVPAQEERTNAISAVDGFAEGRMGDLMRTYFFDYSVNSAQVCDAFEGVLPSDDNVFLIADVTVQNTSPSPIEMYDTDFQAQWNSEDDFSLPITFDLATGDDLGTVSDKQLPGTYTLGVDEVRTGLLVFEVPAGNRDFSISYQEYFSDNTTGDVFFVFFTAAMNSSKPAAVPSKEEEKTDSASGIRPEFKEMMDSYEAFFDEYITFMEKYQNADGTAALSMLSDLSSYMTKYAEYMAKLDAVDQDELSPEESVYYLEVSARIMQKVYGAL